MKPKYYMEEWESPQTWLAHDFIIRDEKRSRRWRKHAAKVRKSVLKHNRAYGRDAIDEQVICKLASDMREGEVTKSKYKANGFCAALFDQALLQINWHEVAQQFVLFEPVFSEESLSTTKKGEPRHEN